MTAPNERAVAPAATKGDGELGNLVSSQASQGYMSSRKAATEDAGLRAWAARRATRLAADPPPEKRSPAGEGGARRGDRLGSKSNYKDSLSVAGRQRLIAAGRELAEAARRRLECQNGGRSA